MRLSGPKDIEWIAAELHCHTVHSDGRFTVESLLECAKRYDLSLIALTDHNTAAGVTELSPALESKYVPVIRGIEWTAYYGHMLVLDADRFVDWRDVTKDGMDEKIREVKENGGLVGLAHPFSVGSPICTGCCWEYTVSRWDLVDYIEVWSVGFPSIHRGRNQRAVDMWQSLLDEGYHIAASYGKDWHFEVDEKEPWGCTYIAVNGSDSDLPHKVKDAIRMGRTMVSMGPRPVVVAHAEGMEILPGDTVREGSDVSLSVMIDGDYRSEQWSKYGFVPESAKVIGRFGAVIAKIDLDGFNPAEIVFKAKKGHFRVVFSGYVMDKDCEIAFTSPYYVNSSEEKQ